MPLPIRSLPIGKCRSLGPPPPPSAVGVCGYVFVAPVSWAMVGAYQRHGACGFIVLFFCFSFLCRHMAEWPGRVVVPWWNVPCLVVEERSLRVTALPWPTEHAHRATALPGPTATSVRTTDVARSATENRFFRKCATLGHPFAALPSPKEISQRQERLFLRCFMWQNSLFHGVGNRRVLHEQKGIWRFCHRAPELAGSRAPAGVSPPQSAAWGGSDCKWGLGDTRHAEPPACLPNAARVRRGMATERE